MSRDFLFSIEETLDVMEAELTSTELIVSFTSIGIAALALFSSFFHAWSIRKHNRLLSQPFIVITRNAAANPIGILVKNSGLGPLKITSIVFTIGNEVADLFERSPNIGSKCNLSWELINKLTYRIFYDYEWVYPGEEVGLWVYNKEVDLHSMDETTSKEIDEFSLALRSLTVTVKGQSVYGTKVESTITPSRL